MAKPGRRFISGHNQRGQRRTRETRRKLSKQKRGERNPQFGKRPPNFIGRQIHAAGYIQIHSPEHPFASKNLVMEHRLVMEAHLRESDPASPSLVEIEGELYLRRELEVHHRNDSKADNRVENLEVLTKAEHARLHMLDSPGRRRAAESYIPRRR